MQEDCQELNAILNIIVSPRPTWTTECDFDSNKQTKISVQEAEAGGSRIKGQYGP